MTDNEDILELVRANEALVRKAARRAVIIQPGALGDCILTLPLAQFMKKTLNLGGIDFIGRAEYMGFLPGRSCIDGIRSMDFVELHRMFVGADEFSLEDDDTLINDFAGYDWIVTFLGAPGGSFEQNLIFTSHCSHAAQVTTLSLKSPADYKDHISTFYIEQFIDSNIFDAESTGVEQANIFIRASRADLSCGAKLLKTIPLTEEGKLVVIHPGSGGLEKCWHMNNFCAIAEMLTSKGCKVVFLSGPAELERFDSSKIKQMTDIGEYISDFSLTQVLQLLSCADCFIGNDSGVTHLAGALGQKTLAVFGPSSPVLYRPIGPAVTTFEVDSADFNKADMTLQHRLCRIILKMLGH